MGTRKVLSTVLPVVRVIVAFTMENKKFRICLVHIQESNSMEYRRKHLELVYCPTNEAIATHRNIYFHNYPSAFKLKAFNVSRIRPELFSTQLYWKLYM